MLKPAEIQSKSNLKAKITLLVIMVLGVASLGASSRETTLYYAATHFPPWDINIEGNQPSGINADIIRSLAEELGLTFKPYPCNWKRCLALLEDGTIDMAGTVGRKPQRERYLHFIEPTYAKVPDKVIYLHAKSKLKVEDYEDLYQLKTIGIERGAKVSPRFDQDSKLMKYDVTKLAQLLKMLNSNRLDVVVGNEVVIDYMIKEMGLQGKFQKADFRFLSEGMEYMAMSKKSPHVNRLPEISKIIHQMKDNGKIEAYIQKYTISP